MLLGAAAKFSSVLESRCGKAGGSNSATPTPSPSTPVQLYGLGPGREKHEGDAVIKRAEIDRQGKEVTPGSRHLELWGSLTFQEVIGRGRVKSIGSRENSTELMRVNFHHQLGKEDLGWPQAIFKVAIAPSRSEQPEAFFWDRLCSLTLSCLLQ